MIPMVTHEYGKYRYNDFVNSRVRYARKAARQTDNTCPTVMVLTVTDFCNGSITFRSSTESFSLYFTWVNKTIGFEELKERLKVTIRTPESAEEYAKMNKAQRDLAKDHGGFVGGVPKGGSRKMKRPTTPSLDSGSCTFCCVTLFALLSLEEVGSLVGSVHSRALYHAQQYRGKSEGKNRLPSDP